MTIATTATEGTASTGLRKLPGNTLTIADNPAGSRMSTAGTANNSRRGTRGHRLANDATRTSTAGAMRKNAATLTPRQIMATAPIAEQTTIEVMTFGGRCSTTPSPNSTSFQNTRPRYLAW